MAVKHIFGVRQTVSSKLEQQVEREGGGVDDPNALNYNIKIQFQVFKVAEFDLDIMMTQVQELRRL